MAVFNGASAFNSDLSAWDVSAVTDMSYSAPHAISVHAHMLSSQAFRVVVCNTVVIGAPAFNGDLSAWDVSAVTNMGYSAPHAISVHAHMSSSHWLSVGGLQRAGLAMCGGRSGDV